MLKETDRYLSVLEYKSHTGIGLKDIMPVLDEHIAWYAKQLEYYFEDRPIREPAPRVFREWLSKAVANRNIGENMAQRLARVHEEMEVAADKFVEGMQESKQAPYKQFKELTRHYEEFIQIMRRIELDQVFENSGFDDKTGLRSPKLMADDIAREMERRSRQGNPFSLAIVKINNYDPKWEKHDEEHRMMIRFISDQIRDCLRSFDDAYYMGGEYFLLALKQTDVIGSKSAVYRLNGGINVSHIKTPGEDSEISVSTVVCEPTPGDSLNDLISNMKNDLNGIDDKGTIVQFNDISPLQRYIHSITKK